MNKIIFQNLHEMPSQTSVLIAEISCNLKCFLQVRNNLAFFGRSINVKG